MSTNPTDITNELIAEFNAKLNEYMHQHLTAAGHTCAATYDYSLILNTLPGAPTGGNSSNAASLSTGGAGSSNSAYVNVHQSGSESWSERLDTISSFLAGHIENIVSANYIEELETPTAFDPQDVKEGLVFPDVAPYMKKVTSTSEMSDLAWNPMLSYPEVSAKADKTHWVKINHVDQEMEIVHTKSGSYLKIDQEGNVSAYLAGSLKLIIDKDFLTNVLGNCDDIVMGDRQVTTLGSSTTETTGIMEHKGESVGIFEYELILLN